MRGLRFDEPAYRITPRSATITMSVVIIGLSTAGHRNGLHGGTSNAETTARSRFAPITRVVRRAPHRDETNLLRCPPRVVHGYPLLAAIRVVPGACLTV